MKDQANKSKNSISVTNFLTEFYLAWNFSRIHKGGTIWPFW